MTIHTIVLSGGGPVVVQMTAGLYELERLEKIHREDIRTIFGTSAGAIAGFLYLLNFEWDVLYTYIVERPWEEVFSLSIANILSAYSRQGLFGPEIIQKCIGPLLGAKGLPYNITLETFYRWCNVEMVVTAFDVISYSVVDISYKTHPTMQLTTLIQLACAIPFLVSPVYMDGSCYMDGGVACNYPLSRCLQRTIAHNEIIGCKVQYHSIDPKPVSETSTLLEYIMYFLFKSIFHIRHVYELSCDIPNEIIFETELLSLNSFKRVVQDREYRRELITKGIDQSNKFIFRHRVE